MKTSLKMKCPHCKHWNKIPADKLFSEQQSPDPKIKVYIPLYKPLEYVKCSKCNKTIAKPNELIKITKTQK